MYIIMLGKPGSGKGTVGKMLSEELGIVHISSGDLFRSYVKNAGKSFFCLFGNLPFNILPFIVIDISY